MKSISVGFVKPVWLKTYKAFSAPEKSKIQNPKFSKYFWRPAMNV